METRLNKFIASTGYCSRREADALITEGKVYVNNFCVTTLGTKIDDQKDKVRIGKREIAVKAPTIIAMNKPRYFVCTKKATHEERTIMELLPKSLQHLNPVGRLDKDSQGLLLLSNDGNLLLTLTHPRSHVEKEYEVTVKGDVSEATFDKMRKGVKLFGFTTRPAVVVPVGKAEDRTTFKITLKEGKKRQIREMMLTLGHRVKKLVRIRIGKLKLDPRLPIGAFTFVKPQEIL